MNTLSDIIADSLGWEKFADGPVNTTTESIIIIAERYHQEQSKEGWISVNDKRKPEEYQRCFVWNQRNAPGYESQIAMYTGGFHHGVTHWQKLPLPPNQTSV